MLADFPTVSRFRPLPFFVTTLGFLLCLFGIAGFVQNAPHLLFGLFRVTFFHSVFFIFLGIVLLLARKKNTRYSVTMAMLSIGYIFLILAIVGIVRLDKKDSINILFNLFSLNYADNMLHLILSINILSFGYFLRK